MAAVASGALWGVSRKRIALLRQILLFALFTFLGLATNYVASESHPPPACVPFSDSPRCRWPAG